MPGHSLAPRLIQRIVIGRTGTSAASTGDVIFHDIPQHYQHLGLRIIGQLSGTAVTGVINLDVNPDSGIQGAVYYQQLRVIAGTTVAATSSNTSSPQAGPFGVLVGSNASNLLTNPGVFEAMIYCYSSPHWRYKSWTTRSWAPAQNSTSNIEQYFYGGRVDMSLSSGYAITSLRITADTSTVFLNQSQFELIGHP